MTKVDPEIIRKAEVERLYTVALGLKRIFEARENELIDLQEELERTPAVAPRWHELGGNLIFKAELAAKRARVIFQTAVEAEREAREAPPEAFFLH